MSIAERRIGPKSLISPGVRRGTTTLPLSAGRLAEAVDAAMSGRDTVGVTWWRSVDMAGAGFLAPCFTLKPSIDIVLAVFAGRSAGRGAVAATTGTGSGISREGGNVGGEGGPAAGGEDVLLAAFLARLFWRRIDTQTPMTPSW